MPTWNTDASVVRDLPARSPARLGKGFLPTDCQPPAPTRYHVRPGARAAVDNFIHRQSRCVRLAGLHVASPDGKFRPAWRGSVILDEFLPL